MLRLESLNGLNAGFPCNPGGGGGWSVEDNTSVVHCCFHSKSAKEVVLDNKVLLLHHSECSLIIKGCEIIAREFFTARAE